MSTPPLPPTLTHAGTARVRRHATRTASGSAAAATAAALIRAALAARGSARIMVATGNSQLALIDALMADDYIAWDRVEAFHMDEYVGLPATHSASFRLWLNTRVAGRRPLRAMHLIAGDAPSPAAEIARYTALLSAGPIDVAFVGFGENGHIAFNDPPVADFNDPAMLKVVTLDEACRRQQVGEGHFPHLDAVPREAITVTCTGLFRAAAWVCCVPEARKAQAVRDALEGPISTACPASLVRRHPQATVFLDPDSAALLQQPPPLEA
ncbi:MAG: glucosamine-6-phosphate deaminase [Verrucomicrobia bacterium]|nr:glucosamine-6-phosphate deaminase [Verrucomicrobiota bacterium]